MRFRIHAHSWHNGVSPLITRNPLTGACAYPRNGMLTDIVTEPTAVVLARGNPTGTPIWLEIPAGELGLPKEVFLQGAPADVARLLELLDQSMPRTAGTGPSRAIQT